MDAHSPTSTWTAVAWYSRTSHSRAGAVTTLMDRAGPGSVLPMLKIPPLPCWLAVHREIRGSALVRHAFDFLAEAIPRELAALQASIERSLA